MRLYLLGVVPASINWDEASLGYNAYSILKTGKDEYGSSFPLILRSFDDYKPALYSYLIIPLIPILGLTEIAVRLPSAIAGIAAIFLTYILVIKIFGKEIVINNRKIPTKALAILSSFFLAVSPWHIQFSRIAFESNVGLTLNLTSLLLFLYGLKRPKLLVLAFILGALNIHMYQSDRVFTPLMLIAASIIYYKDIIKIKKHFIIAAICAVLLALPFVFGILSDENALLRARGVSVFADQTPLLERTVDKLIYDRETNNYLGLILDNRRVEYGKQIISGYISHFDLNWLFITGDIARHHAPNMGLLYLVNLPFLFIGIYQMMFGSISRKTKILIFTYFLLVPIPAAVTSGVPHAVRTLNFLPLFQIFIALGLVGTYSAVSSIKPARHATQGVAGGYEVLSLPAMLRKALRAGIKLKYIIIALFLGFSVFNFIYYLNQYFVQQNYFHSRDWLYGYREAISFVNNIDDDYAKVIVSNEPPLDQSYIFFLFYLKVDPSYYQSLGGTATGGFEEKHEGFYNYTFGPIGDADSYPVDTLFVGRKDDTADTPLRVLKKINYPDGENAIVIADK